MLQQQTLAGLSELKLPGMAKAFQQQLDNPDATSLSFEVRLAQLIEAEQQERTQRKQDRMMRDARLKHGSACMEDIDYKANRGLDRSYLSTLANCEWIERHQFMLISGPTGVGKTWLACAFACQAVRKGYSVLYKRFSQLVEELDIARRDGSLPKLRSQLAKAKLLVLDDWAMVPLTTGSLYELLELIDDRCGISSLLVTSQLPVSQWHEYIGEPTLADAIMDRIIHRAHRLELHGESMRKLYRAVKEDT
ncbi:IS21-like element helper ATPase IstB [Shewanella sedimentimangrovi]|uniref:IS21-like element helper ATPase IstB n=1 Tax=Shewanella sedimentimangrovi TaxID=2814293 RepID=A0ABX7R072_9GAMM|nr:IS21-like element helper ATPase IstB [Shewanella sedimentimangrovi]QSX37104.1 IS21-like element helper ATPase IstB [Shewanella sedimentimangrovi]